MTQMREDTPGGGTALRELEVMNILTDRRGSNEFKLNYMCRAPHEHAKTHRGYFKGADIITPFKKFDKREICVRQSGMQNTPAKLRKWREKYLWCVSLVIYLKCFGPFTAIILGSSV